MWNGKSYDEFQEVYQFKSGLYLIENLESVTSLSNKSILDLGCGNGKLTRLLWEKAGRGITAVDADDSMLAVLKEKYSVSEMEVICADIPVWLAAQKISMDIIFSNATFHWFGSHTAMEPVLNDCYKNLSPNGYIAIRFSLKDNALELKQYLEERLADYLGKKEDPYLKQSKLEHERFLAQLETCGFTVSFQEEIRFSPFDDSELDFHFMIKSQPLHKHFTEHSFLEFEKYLRAAWQKKQTKLTSHHGIYIAQKLP